MNNMELPPGWTVQDNPLVGIDILDEFGNIRLQHPSLTPSIAWGAWEVYRNNPAKGPYVWHSIS
jgi:hypothetical protein